MNEAAFAFEAALLKKNGLILPNRCGCSFQVAGMYPGKPWYWIQLVCPHEWRPHPDDERADLLVAGHSPGHKFDWFTGAGELVSLEDLERGWIDAGGYPKYNLDVGTEDFRVTRTGGVYSRNFKAAPWKYAEPAR